MGTVYGCTLTRESPGIPLPENNRGEDVRRWRGDRGCPYDSSLVTFDEQGRCDEAEG